MSDVFISYASQDRPRAKLLAEALQLQGWSVWWDRNIPPGKRFDDVIKEALDSAKCIVVLWSQASADSDWVKEEAAEGQRRGILVPALIDDVTIPFGFRRLQAARLVGWRNESENPEFHEFTAAIAALLRGTAPVPTPSEKSAAHSLSGGTAAAAVFVAFHVIGWVAGYWVGEIHRNYWGGWLAAAVTWGIGVVAAIAVWRRSKKERGRRA